MIIISVDSYPMVGEVLNDMKFNEQEDYILDYEKYAQVMQDLWCDQEPNLFNRMNYRDVDYRFVHPYTMVNEPRLAFKSRKYYSI
jgi:hypothetical protein